MQPTSEGRASSVVGQDTDSAEEVKRLRELVQQRDNEISMCFLYSLLKPESHVVICNGTVDILVGMLKREKRRTAELMAAAKHAGIEIPEPSLQAEDLITDTTTSSSQSQLESVSNGDVSGQQDRLSSLEGIGGGSRVRPSSRLQGRHYQFVNESGKSGGPALLDAAVQNNKRPLLACSVVID